jgi:hypothetical protein
MKDLSQADLDGYYYMNNYMGIDSNQRPLAVQVFPYWNYLCVNIPIIESKYQSNSFQLRVNQLFTVQAMSNPTRLTNTLLHYRVYGFTQEIMSQLNNWATIITNADGFLDKDVRIMSEGNTFKIEKWDKNRCMSRVLTTHYYLNRNPKDRDVTNFSTLPKNWNNEASYAYREECFKLIVIQRPSGIVAFNMNMVQTTSYQHDFTDSNLLNSVWEYNEDDMSNPVIDIEIDTLAHKQVNIYVVHANFQMRRFTAEIPLEGEALQFEEAPTIYNMERIFADKTSSGNKQATTSKKQKIFRNFIANGVFYSHTTTIDMQNSADPETQ